MAERATPEQVQIERWSAENLDLLQRCNAPHMTEHIGGPETDEQVRKRHERYLAISEPGAGAMCAIVLLPEGVKVGVVGYWERAEQAGTVYETGWSVLPEYQGRGIAALATAKVIELARAEERHRFMHAYPSVDNAASNAVCRKLGFELLGPEDFEYPPGNPLRCNNWRFDLSAT